MAQLRRFVRRRTVFAPEDTVAMGDAYDTALLTLREDWKTQRVVCDLLAGRILRLAKTGELDRGRLCCSAVSGSTSRISSRDKNQPMAASVEVNSQLE